MNPLTMQAEIERFMVPVGPEGTEDQELGWPDGTTPPPAPISGMTQAGATGNTTFKSASVTAGAVNGYASVPPYWAGARIVSVAAGLVTLAEPAQHPDGPQVANIAAGSDDQTVFTLPGAPNVALVQEIIRTSDDALIAVDEANLSHDPANGVIAVGAAVPPISTGDDIRFTYLLAFAGPVPAGVAFTVAPPRPSSPPFTTGDAWSAAFSKMVAEGAANGVPPAPFTLAPAEAAMKAVIDGMMAVPGLAAVAIQAGAAAFWGVVAGSFATIFPGSIGFVPPPSLAGMSAAFAAANVPPVPVPEPWDPSVSILAAANFAAAVYSTSQGALVTFPGPSASPFV